MSKGKLKIWNAQSSNDRKISKAQKQLLEDLHDKCREQLNPPKVISALAKNNPFVCDRYMRHTCGLASAGLSTVIGKLSGGHGPSSHSNSGVASNGQDKEQTEQSVLSKCRAILEREDSADPLRTTAPNKNPTGAFAYKFRCPKCKQIMKGNSTTQKHAADEPMTTELWCTNPECQEGTTLVKKRA